MNPSDFVTCTIPCAIAAANVDEGKEAIQIAEPAYELRTFVTAEAAHAGARQRALAGRPTLAVGVNIPVRSEIGRNIDFVTNGGLAGRRRV
jgi:hypothetical protein